MTMDVACLRHRIVLLPALVLLSACTITTHVNPIPRDTVKAVCIKENTATWSKEFLPALRAQFERHGIATSVYPENPPADCRYRVEYDANWGWDLAVYLKYADIRIFDGPQMIGQATYDARGGSGRLDKFGRTDEMLSQLMTKLLTGVGAAGS